MILQGTFLTWHKQHLGPFEAEINHCLEEVLLIMSSASGSEKTFCMNARGL